MEGAQERLSLWATYPPLTWRILTFTRWNETLLSWSCYTRDYDRSVGFRYHNALGLVLTVRPITWPGSLEIGLSASHALSCIVTTNPSKTGPNCLIIRLLRCIFAHASPCSPLHVTFWPLSVTFRPALMPTCEYPHPYHGPNMILARITAKWLKFMKKYIQSRRTHLKLYEICSQYFCNENYCISSCHGEYAE